jgi:hypothetical protein
LGRKDATTVDAGAYGDRVSSDSVLVGHEVSGVPPMTRGAVDPAVIPDNLG